MTKLRVVDLEKLKEYEDKDIIRSQDHPSYPLKILNYTEKTQFKKAWDLYTLSCRGLVIDRNTGRIIARPFAKFFNLEEHQVLPNLPFEIQTKIDGSLGILFHYNNEWIMATRGSFTSEQAIEGMKILDNLRIKEYLRPELTYLVEIIYPENRIVVDYGANRQLILLALVNTETGEEVDIKSASHLFKTVDVWDYRDIDELKNLKIDNFEGFVLKFENNFRVKIKLEEYKRLHKIVTGVSSRSIWEAMRFKAPIEELISNVPDEFHQWVIDTKKELESRFEVIKIRAVRDFIKVPKGVSRKEQALYIQKHTEFPQLMFLYLDNKPVEDAIWKMLEPKYEQPFKQRVNQTTEKTS